MDPGHTQTEVEIRGIDGVLQAVKSAAEKAEEAASKVEQHSMIHESLRTGQEESQISTAMTGRGSTSRVKESQFFGHSQVALRAKDTAAKVHAMIHQAIHTATEFTVPRQKTHTNGDQSFRGGFDVRSVSETTARAVSKAEAGTVRVEKHSLAVLYPGLIADEIAARIGSSRHSPHDDVFPMHSQPLNSIVPLTPDDSSEEHSQKLVSEPRVSSFGSQSRDSRVINTPYLGHTPNLFLNSNMSSSDKGRSLRQNLIDMIMTESQQLSIEAPALPKKRGRPRGSKSSAHIKSSTGKLQDGESMLSFQAGQHAPAPSTGPTSTKTPLSESTLPSMIHELPVVKSRVLEGFQNDVCPWTDNVQSLQRSTSSTGKATVSEGSVTVVPSVADPQAQLLLKDNILKNLFETEIESVSTSDTPLCEPNQPGTSDKSSRKRSTGTNLPSPQQKAVSLPVSGLDTLVRARKSKRRHQKAAQSPYTFSFDGANDAPSVDKTSKGSFQPGAFSTFTSGPFFAAPPRRRHSEVASHSVSTSSKTSRRQGNIYESIEGDPESRLQPASSRSQPSRGASRPQRLQAKIVDYVERPLDLDLDTDTDPDIIVPPPTNARRAKCADRSPSPPPDPTARRKAYYVPQPVSRDFESLLRHREVARGNWRAPCVNNNLINAGLRTHLAQNLGCWRSWTGASKDIVTTAWAPNGSMYAVGASTEMDNLNIQYNRPNNLLLGDRAMNTLTELPDHYIDRPRPETIESGDNARQDTYNAVDPELYTTVSHVCFGYESDLLFSASFDKTVKIWDVASGRKAKCVQTLRHQAKVELLSLGRQPMRILATGQRAIENSIVLYDIDKYGLENSPTDATATLQSERAIKSPRFDIYPTCLLFGPSQSSECLLLAGFSEARTDFVPDQEGDLVLWDVETLQPIKLRPSTQAVQDIAWHPFLPIFAAATVPGSRLNLTHRRTQSVIRTYHPKEGPSRIMEYECPAFDINDVRYNPFDDHYISAGCTNGTTYVWDERMPETILQKLRHGPPIDTLDPDLTREEQDTGVRFTGWSRDGLYLHTGSSDGTIKCWNIFVSPEDAFVRDIAQFDAGVMTGTFSPDQRELVVGLSNGSVHLISSAPDTHDPIVDADEGSDTEMPCKPYEAIEFIPAKHPVSVEPQTGVDRARDLLLSAQIEIHPIYGAGKGPEYEGPYATYARPEGVDPKEVDLNPEILAGQLDPIQRKRGRRLGGRQDKVARDRYREMGQLAEARNGPGWLREPADVRKGGWMFEKAEVWWDVEAGDDDDEREASEV